MNTIIKNTFFAFLATTGVAQAQDINLRVADSLSSGHYIAEGLLMPFMDEIDKKTDGNVKFQYFPAQQLGKAKDMLSLTQTGVTDIGYVGASYVAEKMPLSSVGQLPGSFSTSCEGTMAFWEIAKPGGILDQAEFAPQGVRALMVLALTPYQLFSSGEITSLESFNNLKVRATGGAQEIMLSKLGSVPIQMSAPETREALSRGTINAIVFPHSSIEPYDLTPYLKTGTEGVNLGSFVASYMISQEKFDSLPIETQKAMTEAGEHATRTACELADARRNQDKKKIADEGVKFVQLSEEDIERLTGLLNNVSEEWASDLDSRGKPGTEILTAFRNALEK
ncbi:TRAP transporter substrate-binding protein DctP [Marinobacterium sp. MBR-109]|uniref:TRAP transporter substrate-binding protein n=1 Tax=Marinobacterium sp. MBR-109 TaxID=3156462 RepID=UPI003398D67D